MLDTVAENVTAEPAVADVGDTEPAVRSGWAAAAETVMVRLALAVPPLPSQ